MRRLTPLPVATVPLPVASMVSLRSRATASSLSRASTVRLLQVKASTVNLPRAKASTVHHLLADSTDSHRSRASMVRRLQVASMVSRRRVDVVARRLRVVDTLDSRSMARRRPVVDTRLTYNNAVSRPGGTCTESEWFPVTCDITTRKPSG